MTEPGADEGATPSIREELAYLLLFSEALLELVPDGVAVLDDRLRVRAANSAFARLLGLSRDSIQGAATAGRGPFAAPVPQRGGLALGHVLREAFESVPEMTVTVREPPAEPGGESRGWVVRAASWDVEDAQSRRIVVWLRSTGPGQPLSPPLRSLHGEQHDRLFALTRRSRALLDHLPLGVLVLDPSLRVLSANRHLEEAFGRAFRVSRPGDRHLFAVFPELRDDEFRERLETCRDSADSLRGILTGSSVEGFPLEIDVEILPVEGPDGAVGELLLLFHEVTGMSPASSPSSEAPRAASGETDKILVPENINRWHPQNRRILVVEKDDWARMLLSDALREAGHEDVTLAASAAEALGTYDPAGFGLVIAGFDDDADEAASLCRRLTSENPSVPVLAVVQRADALSPQVVSGLPLLGVLMQPKPADLGAVLGGLFRQKAQEAPAQASGPASRDRPLVVVVIGAGDADVAVLRLLYRVQRMRIRMVYDPDPNAFGLSLAQNLGIAALSGELTMKLETPPDAVVMAREGLEEAAQALGLEGVPRVTRDELELFLVDPDSFLAADRKPEVPPSGEPPPTLGAQAMLRPPERQQAPPPLPSAAWPMPTAADSEVRDEPGAAPHVAAPSEALLPAEEVEKEPLPEDLDSILGALDLLLDFDRFADHVLCVAMRLVNGLSGSLMVVREDGNELRIVASRGLSELIVQKARRKVGEGVAGKVAENGEPLLMKGTIGDKEREWTRPDVRSALCVPVMADGRVVGVLNINSDPETGQQFDDAALEEIAALGRKVGPALDRSLLLRRMRGRSFELSVRGEIEKIANRSDDPVSCVRTIAERLVEMLSVDTCAMYLYDSKRGELELRALAGAKASGTLSVPVGSGLVGWVARELKTMALRNDFRNDDESSLSSVALPIRHRTDLVGVLHLESSKAHVTEDRLKILQTVVTVIGQHVGSFRAHEDSERRVTVLSALSELGCAFGAVQEREGLARLVTFSACTLLGTDVSGMRVLAAGRPPSSSADDYEMAAAHGGSLGGPDDPLSELEAALTERVVQSRQSCRDRDLPEEAVRPLLEKSNVATALALPLTTGDGELLGILSVYRVADSHVLPFRDDDVDIGTRLADHAASSLERFVSGLRPDQGPGPGTE